MSKKEYILELLENKELTSQEISEQTKIPEDEVRVYLNRLKVKRLITDIGRKGRYIIYTANSLELKRTNLIDKLVLLMIKAQINCADYDIDIREEQVKPSLNRLIQQGEIKLKQES